MKNVTPLRQSDISPHMVLTDLAERAAEGKIEEIYIVTVDNEGKLGVAWVGDVAGISLASHAMSAIVSHSISLNEPDDE